MDTKIVKYDFNKLELIDDNELLKLKDSGSTVLDDFPIVYILRNEKEAYIGESISANRRLKQHYSDSRRKQMTDAYVIYNEYFNKSAIDNIETNLINLFIAENKYKLQNTSKTNQKYSHNYYNKKYYNEIVFPEIWDQLRAKKIVDTDLNDLENRDIYKISPFKQLSVEQYEMKDQIIDLFEKNDEAVALVSGEAGTGKSVLISSIYNTIQEMSKEKSSIFYNTNNYILVNHNEVLKTYESISRVIPHIQKSKIMKPTSFINNKKIEVADVVIIDEAHLLLTMPDAFNSFTGNNQLEEILKKAKKVIIIYDDKQFLKVKSYWNSSIMDSLLKSKITKRFTLQMQYRMNASSLQTMWIDNFVYNHHTKLYSDNNYEVRFFDSLEEMHKAIKIKNNEVGLSRIVSTFDFEHKKDGKTYYVGNDDYKLPWNLDYSKHPVYKNTPWAEIPETINEVGSIYTIQGFDLNYVGVVIGPSISLDEATNSLKIDPSKYKDTGAFNNASSLEKPNKVKEMIIRNSLNVLMKRGVRGLYIYFSN